MSKNGQGSATPVHTKATRAVGIRMNADLWDFVEDVAAMKGTSKSDVIAQWVADRRADLVGSAA